MIPVLHRAQEKQAPSGIGVELDVWLAPGPAAVVGHDCPEMDFQSLFHLWLKEDVRSAGFRPLYAVNCKSDGLEQPLAEAFDRYGVSRDRWFAFDMSYPSQRVFEKMGLPFAERVSEEEPWRARSYWIWLDRWAWRDNASSFAGVRRFPGPPSERVYLPYFDARGHKIEVHAVSMELHVADSTEHERRNWWRWLFDEVRPESVCTDYPDDLMRTWEEWRCSS